MGVPGLWDLIRPAAARTSLSALSREAFHANPNGLRAFRVGIDASIWIFHAQVTHYGENPFLRTIFFKITALLQQPVLPVFVFDGPNKPGQKRNENVKGKFGTADHKSKQFKALLDVCGLEWWTAPGEAEAELAVMNRQGKIDAVLSDDVDALLFGATCLLRNNSPTLSGAQASTTGINSARSDLRHYEVFRSSAIKDMWLDKEGTTLRSEEDCRMAMVLIALLSGGDYAPKGLPSIGPTISLGLANAGLSEFLKKYDTQRSAFTASLPEIHARIIDELRTNASKQVGRRYPKRADDLAALPPQKVFPDDTLDAYLNPCTSPLSDPSQGWPGFGKGESVFTLRGKARNEGRGDMEGMARACETYFEWGTKEIVCKKFAGESVGIFGAEVVNEARELVRERSNTKDIATSLLLSSSPPLPLVHQSVGTSQAASSSRITSFFQQAAPSSSQISVKSSQLSSQIHPQTQPYDASPIDDGEPPEHVIKIHSVRADPMQSDLGLNEYRVAFRHAGYIDRCQNAMKGTRSDPADLSDNSRQRLGLREKEIDPDNIAEQGDVSKTKDEIRVWMAEYLVREAWPELVKVWEEEQAAKASKLLKRKKPVSKSTKSKEKTVVAPKGVDTAAFAAFFSKAQSQRPISASPTDEEEERESQPRGRGQSMDISMLSSSDNSRSTSDLAIPAKKSRARPAPTSSLSSLPEAIEKQRSKSPSASSRAKARSKSRRTSTSASKSPPTPGSDDEQTKSLTTATAKRSSSPKPRSWAFGKRIFSKSKSSPSALASPGGAKSRKSIGGKDKPIDLCSTDSDEQTPVKAPPRSRRRSASKDLAPGSLSAPVEGSDVETPKVRSPRTRKSSIQVVASSPSAPSRSNPQEPIEISSDAESPIVKPPRARRTSNRTITSSPQQDKSASTAILRPSNRANTLSPSFDEFFEMTDSAPSSPPKSTSKRSTPKSRPKKSTTQETKQSTPSFPFTSDHHDISGDTVDRDSEFTKETSRSSKRTPSPKKQSKKTRYVVLSETSDEEEIDCTRKR
ncbi:hypothetical protein IAT40_007289 [Kwoniella sp. CBS 6097]